MLGPGADLPAPRLQGASSYSEGPGAGARGHPEAAMVRTRACSGARTSSEAAGAGSWMSSGGAERGPRRVASTDCRPSVPRKWVETAVVPAQVKVRAAAANTHDRNVQDVLARLATLNGLPGCSSSQAGKGCQALGRRVSFGCVHAPPHLRKVPARSARQSTLLHSLPLCSPHEGTFRTSTFFTPFLALLLQNSTSAPKVAIVRTSSKFSHTFPSAIPELCQNFSSF